MGMFTNLFKKSHDPYELPGRWYKLHLIKQDPSTGQKWAIDENDSDYWLPYPEGAGSSKRHFTISGANGDTLTASPDYFRIDKVEIIDIKGTANVSATEITIIEKAILSGTGAKFSHTYTLPLSTTANVTDMYIMAYVRKI